MAARRTVRFMGRSSASVAAALILAGCASFSDLDTSKFSLDAADSKATNLVLESEPAGAEARTSLGASCRTPCALPIKPSPDFTVTFALDGYQQQSFQVKVTRTYSTPDYEAALVGAGAVKLRTDPELEPNPIHVVLAALPPPPEPPKPPAKKKPRTAAKPAAAKPDQAYSGGFPPASAPAFSPSPR